MIDDETQLLPERETTDEVGSVSPQVFHHADLFGAVVGLIQYAVEQTGVVGVEFLFHRALNVGRKALHLAEFPCTYNRCGEILSLPHVERGDIGYGGTSSSVYIEWIVSTDAFSGFQQTFRRERDVLVIDARYKRDVILSDKIGTVQRMPDVTCIMSEIPLVQLIAARLLKVRFVNVHHFTIANIRKVLFAYGKLPCCHVFSLFRAKIRRNIESSK